MTDCLVRFEDVQFLRKDFRRFFEALVSRLCKSYSRNLAEDAVASALQTYCEKIARKDARFLSLRMSEQEWTSYVYRLAKWNLIKGIKHDRIDGRHSRKAFAANRMGVSAATPSSSFVEKCRDLALVETLKRVCVFRGIAKRNRIAYERCYLMNQDVRQVAADMGMTANAIYIARHRIEKCLLDDGADILRRVRFDVFNAAA